MSRKEKDSHSDVRPIDPTPLKTVLNAHQLTVTTYGQFVNEIDKAKQKERDDNPSGQINPELLK